MLQLIEHEQNNETLLFEALTVNDELDKVLEKLAELQKQVSPPAAAVPSPAPAAPTPSQPSSQMADLLAPPQALPLHQQGPPVMAFAVPSGEHDADADGEEALVRTRVGAGEASAPSAGGTPGAPPAGDDERALAELDAMVFGRASHPAQAPPAQGSQGALPAASSGQSKGKEDDLILF